MRHAVVGFLFSAFCLSSGMAQTSSPAVQERKLPFAYTQRLQNAGEIATILKITTDAPEVKLSTDAPPTSITMHGTPEQIALAEWIFLKLDRPTDWKSGPELQEFKMAGEGDNRVRIYFIKHADTMQNFQEIATAVRTVAEVRRLTTFNEQRAIVVRGTDDQMAVTAWLFQQLDKPAGGTLAHLVSAAYQMPDTRNEGAVKVFYFAQAKTVRDFQEGATLLRAVASIRRVFTYNELRAVTVRGTPEQVALAEWLFNRLDQPPPGSGTAATYSAYKYGDEAVRVYNVPATSDESFLKVTTQIRTAANLRQAYTYRPLRALVIRATEDQMARVDSAMADLEKP